MHVKSHLARNRAVSQPVLVKRLVTLADEAEGAGLRHEARLLVELAYSVLDSAASPLPERATG
jgi:hypothetical protein